LRREYSGNRKSRPSNAKKIGKRRLEKGDISGMAAVKGGKECLQRKKHEIKVNGKQCGGFGGTKAQEGGGPR